MAPIDRKDGTAWSRLCRFGLLVAITLTVFQCEEAPPGDARSNGPEERKAAGLDGEFALAAELPSSKSVVLDQNLAIELILIEPGTFTMGRFAQAPEAGSIDWMMAGEHADEGPQHEVTITQPYYIMRTPVTVELYCAFLNDTSSPTKYIYLNRFARVIRDGDQFAPRPGCEDYPVNTVPWVGAVRYSDWLSEKLDVAMRLPTEAEWAFAARGPESRHYPWGNDATRRNYHAGPRLPKDEPWAGHPVGTNPNGVTPTGIHDFLLIGEWVLDWYSAQLPAEAQTDPHGPRTGEVRTFRGRDATWTKATSRDGIDDKNASTVGFLGFRLVMELEAEK